MAVSIYNSRRPLTFMNSVTVITCVIGSMDRTVPISAGRKEHYLFFSKKTEAR